VKVGNLKKLIQSLPDDMEIVSPGRDHSYDEIDCVVVSALKDKYRNYTEDYGEEATPEAQYGKRVNVLCCGGG